MKCSIVRDLLPAYVEGLTGEDTARDIKEHMESCEGCSRVYRSMAAVIPSCTASADSDIRLVKKLKSKLRRNNIIAAAVTCVLFGLLLFAVNYEVPLTFDVNRMTVGTVPSVFVFDEKEGSFFPRDLDSLSLKDTKDVQDGKYRIYDLVQIGYRSIKNAVYISQSRTINRDGREVRVTYFCFYKTIWNSLLFGDLFNYSESGASFGDIYENRTPEKGQEYRPVETEIYYLQDGVLLGDKTDTLSDEAFDALKEKGWLIWGGMA